MHADQHLRETPLARTELLRGHFMNKRKGKKRGEREEK